MQYQILAAALTAVLANSMSLQALAGGNGEVLIIDASVNTKDFVKDLADLGITVIGRYFGRCPQPDIDEKRLIDNKGEAELILDEPRVSIMSIYQFYSRKEKFKGSRKLEAPRTKDSFNDCVEPTKPYSLTEEGHLDGYAAAQQAKSVGQPEETAIYFGVDYDADLSGTRSTVTKNIIDYFTAVKSELEKPGFRYRVGAYGNGAALDLLRAEKLIEFAWLNASPDHQGSASTYNLNNWDMLQTKTDIFLTLKARKLQVDTDIQNPNSANKYLGFWRRKNGGDGKYTVPQKVNEVIFGKRRFVCNSLTFAWEKSGRKGDPRFCLEFGKSVRVVETGPGGAEVLIDYDENGDRLGWVLADHLGTARPDFDVLRENKKRGRQTTCPATKMP